MRYAVVRKVIVVSNGKEHILWDLLALKSNLVDALKELKVWRSISPEDANDFYLGA